MHVCPGKHFVIEKNGPNILRLEVRPSNIILGTIDARNNKYLRYINGRQSSKCAGTTGVM